MNWLRERENVIIMVLIISILLVCLVDTSMVLKSTKKAVVFENKLEDVYQDSVKDNLEDSKNVIENQDSYFNEDNEKEKYLYHITKNFKSDGNYYFYDFYIDKEYKVFKALKKYSYEEMKKFDKGNVYDLRSIEDNLRKGNHNLLNNLSQETKDYIKETLNKVNYKNDFETTMKAGINGYTVSDYGNGKAITSNENNNDLTLLIEGLVRDDVKYFSYLTKDNSVTNYIKDKKYQVLDLNSELVKKFASSTEVRMTSPVSDMYEKGKITNNEIITQTLSEMENDKEYTCVDYSDEPDDYECFFHMEKFDSYAKKKFGTNVTYDISSYEKYGNGCGIYYYSKKDKKLVSKEGTGCGIFEMLLYKPVYAYQIDNKIVVIEESLFSTLGSCEGSPCYTEKYSLKRGLYTNIIDRFNIVTLASDEYRDFDKEWDLYKPFVTYYASTYTKRANGEYYFTNFSKLN